MTRSIDTVIIGGGQAGLATSHHLKSRLREHVVLERSDRAGSAWRDGRWDSFTLVTPNWTVKLPDAGYAGNDPEGFLPRREIIATFERYVDKYELPVRYGVKVTAVERDEAAGRYLVSDGDERWSARHVVVATGPFQAPKIPAYASGLSSKITQLHSGEYRNPRSVPDGAVLVVGSAQSGCQIAEELYRAGRTVYLCLGRAGRAPRRYRGRDVVDWMYQMGQFDATAETLPSAKARFAANPHLSGRDGGRTLSLHQFARDGVILLGHIRGVAGDVVHLAPDCRESVAKADAFEAELVRSIDAHIAQTGIFAPEETLPLLTDAYQADTVERLSLRSAGISTIIWAMGYRFDYRFVRLPVFDSEGYPVQTRGVTACRGLYFMGLQWMHKRKSSLLLGVGEDAEYIASAIDLEG